MPFAYYARLTRAQQAVYRASDAVTETRLSRPSDLGPLVSALGAALGSENRAATQAATERLIHGLTEALGIPRVRVEVLAARPHARWGELHGLYTAERGKVPKIQLWMRTAKQRRVVAFRTFLRTLLHEVGHHVDYTHLRLKDSYHTEGFYKRESSLFRQLLPEGTVETPSGASGVDGAGKAGARSAAFYARLPRAEKLERLRRGPSALARVLRGQSDAALSRRPDATSWSAKEVVCHLRDSEELFMTRFQTLLAVDGPPMVEVGPADRWAEERQYHRHHAGEAWDAWSRRRDETLELLARLEPDAWARSGTHPRRGRLTIEDFVSLMVSHDDNHLDQARRAIEGRP